MHKLSVIERHDAKQEATGYDDHVEQVEDGPRRRSAGARTESRVLPPLDRCQIVVALKEEHRRDGSKDGRAANEVDACDAERYPCERSRSDGRQDER